MSTQTKRNSTLTSGDKEGTKLTRFIGLVACTALLSAGMWIFSSSQAQDHSSETNPWAEFEKKSTSPQSVDAAFQSAGRAGNSTTTELRIQNLMAQAQKMAGLGEHHEARRLASMADALATRGGVKFSANEITPKELLATLPKPQALPQHTAAPTIVSKTPQDQRLLVEYLLNASKSYMEKGDLEAAREKALEASKIKIEYGPFDERPEQYLAAIAREQEKLGNNAPEGFGSDPFPGTPTQNVAGAQNGKAKVSQLLSQAKTALQQKNYEKARELALEADNIPVTYDLFEETPEQVLVSINQARGDMLFAKKAKQATPKEQALALLAQSKEAIKANQFDEARALALEASKFDVTYELFDDTPDQVLASIDVASGTKMFAKTTTKRTTTTTSTTTQSSMSPQPTRNLASADSDDKQAVDNLLQKARKSLAQGLVADARALANEAARYNVEYGSYDDRPELVLADVNRVQMPVNEDPSMLLPVPTRPEVPNFAAAQPEENWGAPETAAVAADDPFATPANNAPIVSGLDAYNEGLLQLQAGNRQASLESFKQAYASRHDLTSVQRQQLQDFLRDLSANAGNRIQLVNNETSIKQTQPGAIDMAAQRQSVVFDKLRSESLNAIFKAERLREKNAPGALKLLDDAITNVQTSDLDANSTKMLLGSLQRSRSSLESYMAQREPLIEMQRKNAETKAIIAREIETKIRVEQELAKLVEEFNRLIDERRFPEANKIAKEAEQLDPQNPVVVTMKWKAKFATRVASNDRLRDRKEEGFWNQLDEVEQSAVYPFKGDNPIVYQDAKKWAELTARRAKYGGPDNRRRTEEELHIQESLSVPISLHFDNKPLSEVVSHIAKLADINVVVDELGLEEEGVTSNTPVTINVDGIQLQNALEIMLEQLRLDYVIGNEVLKITSKLRQQGDLIPVVYPVADLVVPLPSFLNNSLGKGGALNAGNVGNTAAAPQMSIPSAGGLQNPYNQGFGQVGDAGLLGPGVDNGMLPNGERTPQDSLDFGTLTDLIVATVDPGTWDEVGGQGSVRSHESTLSLVIRQTQKVHDEIADLLEQLRRLQDLQVTIEVRFITVSDRFFERIGVDFDFNVEDTIGGPDVQDDGSPLSPFGKEDGQDGGGGGAGGAQAGMGGAAAGAAGNPPFDTHPLLNLVSRDQYASNTIVGLNNPDSFSPDLDIPFRQGSFQVGVPDFGNFNPDVGIQVGFAVLSDIEAFFFIQAAQSDERSNIMFAPKVTLFNGQTAQVTDAVIRPFVTSIQPSVGFFSVGFQPVITPLQEGVSLFVQAVISADRRYVRLSVLPLFTNITDVFTFSFLGGGGGGLGGGGGGFGGQGGGGFGGGGFGGGGGGFGGGGFGGGAIGIGGIGGFGGQGGGFGGQGGGGNMQGQQGGAASTVTVQQPVQEQVFVQTVVSVPDGGTVLLGGVKRLREGRNMAGVPILNKIPYVSRLFKNTGVGRETESLMLMVTPRIIIQEEEEELLGVEL